MSHQTLTDDLPTAIRDLIAATRLANEFSPGSYTASAFNAALAVAQIAEREAQLQRHDAAPDDQAMT